MAFVRNVAFPAVWSVLKGLHLTKRWINTHEVTVYANGVSNQIIQVLADTHIGGVHKDVNRVLIDSQRQADRIIGNTPCITVDLGDIMTLWNIPRDSELRRKFFIGQKHHETWYWDINRLWSYFYNNALKSEWQTIFGVKWNHDMRMWEKIFPTKLEWLQEAIGEIGVQYLTEPVVLGNGRVKIHTMPCFNTQSALYGSKLIRDLVQNINSHSGVNIVMVHNPDGVKRIEAMKKSLWLSIDVPTLFLCGHTHGLLGFQDVPIIGDKLSNGARKWIGMEADTQYVSGYYPATSGEPYGTFVSQGMGDQADIFRILWGGRERPILRFVEKKEDADIVLGA